MKERPTSVTVFAIINLVLSGLGVVGLIFWLIGKLGLMPTSSHENPALELMENSAGFQLFTDISTGLGLVVIILLISASIGMFSLKPWARKVTIGWGVYSIFMAIIGMALNYVVIFGPLLADLDGPERIGMMIGMIFAIVFTVFFIGYYLLMIFMLTRPHVVEAFTPDPYDNELDDWDSVEESGGAKL
jgi:hypothetical protein